MEGDTDIYAGTFPEDLADRLRARDQEVTERFLRSWIGPVHRYCAMVCEPGLVAEAVEAGFVDFFEKIQSYPIDDEHLEPALRRCARLASAERAIVDDRIATAESNGGPTFDCKTTPLFLAGSPRVRAGVRVLDRMRSHVAVCPRCQASENRFGLAEANFQDAGLTHVPDEVLEAVLDRFLPAGPRGAGQEEPHATQLADEVTVPGFTTLSLLADDDHGLAVYAVLDQESDQPATLWMAAKARDRPLAARFLHDARLLAEISHGSVPGVRAVGESTDGPYLVTDALHGRSLLSVVGSGPLSDRTLRMLGEVADALDAVHGAGLIHGQVRPQNIVVGEWLVVHPVIVGFGLGREVAPDGPQAPYMAPEQGRGEAAGPSTDLHAFACTLFEFLTGVPPVGASPDTARRHLDDAPPRVGQGLPETLDAVFERALAKDPDDRPASAKELMSAVARALSPPAPRDVPVPDSEPEPDVGPQPEPEPEVDVAPEPEPEPESAVEPEVEADSGPAEIQHSGEEATDFARERAAAEPPRGEGLRLSLKHVILASLLAAGAVVALLVVLAGGSSEGEDAGSASRSSDGVRSDRQPVRPEPRTPALVPVLLRGARATDFDPNGGNGERPNDVGRVIDGNLGTAWQTELYPAGTFGGGVGVYIGLPRPEAVRQVTLRTSTPGWDAEIYGASNGPPSGLLDPGWTRLASRSRLRGTEQIPLGATKPIRFCLVWVKKLPPGKDLVSIGEVGLSRAG